LILSDADIKQLIARGRLRVEPFDPSIVRENGLDLRLGNTFCKLRDTARVLDTRKPLNPREFYDCVSVGDGEGYVVEPRALVLAHTVETVCLPDDLVGLVNLRSTFARTGIYIPPTVVDAGFCGQLTVELVGSSFPVKLYPGQRFLHLVLVKTVTPAEKPYSGRYQGQRGVTLPRLPI
jgi:dCTP deaminase